MNILWFVVGLALGCIFFGLQWIQVKKIAPDGNMFPGKTTVFYSLRLILFFVVTATAMRNSITSGMIVFAGFWSARSFFLMFIGSGRVRLAARRD